jgi:hypothetical protein
MSYTLTPFTGLYPSGGVMTDRQCSWCARDAVHTITDDLQWSEYACEAHAREWFPGLFPAVSLARTCRMPHSGTPECDGEIRRLVYGRYDDRPVIRSLDREVIGVSLCEFHTFAVADMLGAQWYLNRGSWQALRHAEHRNA